MKNCWILLAGLLLPSCPPGSYGQSEEKEVTSLLSGPRSKRFPSIEERVKLYMSNWFSPPCNGYSEGLVRFRLNEGNYSLEIYDASDLSDGRSLELGANIVADTAFFMQLGKIVQCSEQELKGKKHVVDIKKWRPNRNMKRFCIDVVETILPAIRSLQWEEAVMADHVPKMVSTKIFKEVLPLPFPVILQFGDLQHSHIFGHLKIPHIHKYRSSAMKPFENIAGPRWDECLQEKRNSLEVVPPTSESPTDHYMQPIIWKLDTRRHYGNLEVIKDLDIPWHKKQSKAIWRGALTGRLVDGYSKQASDKVNCQNLRRCRLVLDYANSTLVDAKLTDTRDNLRDSVVNGIELLGETMSIQDLLQFKAIIMLEGNDVASGLKWALLSNSVVLMSPPKFTSWAMEELLQPWVHYIPLKVDASDAEEKLLWVIDNDKEAELIAQRASLWIEDLVFHPFAKEDDRLIQEEIIRRYATHFASF